MKPDKKPKPRIEQIWEAWKKEGDHEETMGIKDFVMNFGAFAYEQGKLDQSFLSVDKNLGKTTLSEQDIYDILGMYDCLLDSNWTPSYYIKKLIKRLKSQIKDVKP